MEHSAETCAMPQDITHFLMGYGELEGVWFGEMHPTRKGKFWWRSVIRERLAATRPTQTADAVEAAAELLELEALKLAPRTLKFEAPMQLEKVAVKIGKAAGIFHAVKLLRDNAETLLTSTSADSGDREEVEPVAWMFDGTSGTPFWTLESGEAEEWRRLGWKETPLYAHPPTPQDSGLADELEAALYDLEGSDFEVIRKHAATLREALRQPRNDGELLREVSSEIPVPCDVLTRQEYKSAKGNWRSLIDQINNATQRIDAALARLEQGEG